MATTVQLTDLTDYYQADATQDMPDYTALTSTGFCQDGDPVAGKRATLMGAAWFNLLAAMRVSVIKAAGLTPSKTPDPLQETPPLTRGRLTEVAEGDETVGNTPAYAGKTRRPHPDDPPQRKHPRLRGEDGESPMPKGRS